MAQHPHHGQVQAARSLLQEQRQKARMYVGSCGLQYISHILRSTANFLAESHVNHAPVSGVPLCDLSARELMSKYLATDARTVV